jgi:hypothetical protein
MSESDQKRIIAALLKRHGRTVADELGIKLQSDTPSALFRWLCAALLFSAPIGNEIATAAATWEAQTRVLNFAGYRLRACSRVLRS